jgi:hypothetical protein
MVLGRGNVQDCGKIGIILAVGASQFRRYRDVFMGRDSTQKSEIAAVKSHDAMCA